MVSENNTLKRNRTYSSRQQSVVAPAFRSHVSGPRAAGSMRQRNGVDFSQRRSSSPEPERRRTSTTVRTANYGMTSSRRSSEPVRRSSSVQQKAESLRTPSRKESSVRKTSSVSARTREESRLNERRKEVRRTETRRKSAPESRVRHASQSQRRSSAGEAARRRTAYSRRKRRRQQQLRLRFGVMAAVAVLLVFLVFQIFPVNSSAMVEAGTIVNAKDLLRFSFMPASFPEGDSEYDINTPGTYDVVVRAGLFDHTCELTVVDTQAPVVEVQDLSVGTGALINPEDFITSVTDGSETSVTMVSEPDNSIIGMPQEITLSIKDAGGNETLKTANLTILPIATTLHVELGTGQPSIQSFMADVTEPDDYNYIITDLSKIDYNTPGEHEVEFCWKGTKYKATMTIADTTAPVFESAADFTTYLGDSIRYKEHVTVKDNSGSFELEVDTSQVNTEQPGTYDVTYTATDPSGHSSSATLKMTIAEKTADEQLLFEKVDAILAEIITPDMSLKDKVTAIHHYANYNFLFVNDSEKGDYVKAALTMLDIRQGDCYSFFALSKALLTRAGIKNMDIYTLNGTSEHYWNLVDIEDGHGWYHYDSTPTVIPMEILFYTDADLAPLNDGRYDYDRSKFPDIP